MPVMISIFIIIKSLSLALTGSFQIVLIIANGVLILEFFFMLIFALRFFNLEIPNEEIPWSHN